MGIFFFNLIDRALDVLGLFFLLKAVWLYKDQPSTLSRWERFKRAIW